MEGHGEWTKIGYVMGIADVLLHTWFESGDGVRKDTGFVGRREELNEIWGNWIIREA